MRLPPRLLLSRARSGFSASLLLAPMTLVGFTALSVEISTKRAAPIAAATRAAFMVPKTLVRNASISLSDSISGTCL